MGECSVCRYREPCEQLNYLDVANTCSDLREFVDEISADAIDEYKKKIEFEYKWLLDCKVFEPNVGIAFNTLISYAEQLKEQKNIE